MLRTDYYLYMLENEIDKDLKSEFQKKSESTIERDYKSLKLELEQEKKEKTQYKKKYTAIENSRAWRATAPVRKVGRFLKHQIRK